MDRDHHYKNNAGGRSPHTYTPRSYEDLLRSHLQLDADKQTRLQNDLTIYKRENEALKSDLDRAQRELKNKEDEAKYLQNQLKSKPPSQYDRRDGLSVEGVGKNVKLDDVIKHFNGVIQRHHDSINQKNQRIRELHDLLEEKRNQPVRLAKDEGTQAMRGKSSKEIQERLMSEFAQELSQVRKEYETAQHVLTNRNVKLETIIQDLQHKLNLYENEIQHLRRDLAMQDRNKLPSESLMLLKREKEMENENLKELISSLQRQKPRVENDIYLIKGPENKHEVLANEIEKIIQNKKDAIDKLNKIISDIREDPSNKNWEEKNVLSGVERDYHRLAEELDNMNSQLHNILKKLKTPPVPMVQPGIINKNNLLSELENLRKQCQDEIDALKSQIVQHSPDTAPKSQMGQHNPDTALKSQIEKQKQNPDNVVVMRGQAIVEIKNPSSLKLNIPADKLSNEDITPSDATQEISQSPSNVNVYIYPQEKLSNE